ncbi:hypothetical protein JL107_00230 [Nakamurella flavida]|uniref:Uncharacterized protein n=1 Tax=Nakamurella flavida TaxID=363630 RepID=A0A938YKU3_9ACTN|nr:hypothetical protein [Nakamurella flavida]MBM9474863.1 hypothetical protein [Nakamurella flavida]MDP9776433.1 hypothetical protein [Nakamurella flavida]
MIAPAGRRLAPATVLLAVLLAGCSTPTSGTPVAASAAVISSSDATGASTAITVPSTSSSAPAPATVTVTASPTTTVPTPGEDTSTDAWAGGGPSDSGAAVDPVTGLWAGTMCTQLTEIVVAILAAPGADGTEPVDFREEWSAYYAAVADTVITATGRMAALDPPEVVDGAALHEAYLGYLKELGIVTGTASIDVGEAADEQAAQAVVQTAQARIAALSEEDPALAGFEDPAMADVLRLTPECDSLTG